MVVAPQLPSLDHVAIHVADRDAFAAVLVEQLDVRVLERTERFTLVGAHPDHGKLTLLDAVDGIEPEPSRIVSLVLAEVAGADVQPPMVLPGGLVLTFVGVDDLGPGWADTPRHALVCVALRASDPPIMAASLEAELGMHVDRVGPDHAVLDVGTGDGSGGRISFAREAWKGRGRSPMLDHVGIRVTDAEQWRDKLTRAGLDVTRWVEAPHSRAVFVAGPDDLLVEYVELTAPLG